jgi:hypothetical protein
MEYRFEAHCSPNLVEVLLTKHRMLLANETLDPASWKTMPHPISSVVRKLLSLIDDGQATWHESKLVIPNSVAAEFHGTFASAIGLPQPAPIMLDISFHRTIGDRSGQIEIEWKDTHYRSVVPSRSGISVAWGGKTWRLSGPLFDLVEAIESFNRIPGTDTPRRVECWGKIKNALTRVDPKAVDVDDYTKSLTVFQAGSFALDIAEGRGGLDFKPVLMSRSKARSLEDNAPTLELGDSDEAIEEANPFEELVDEKGAALLVSEDHRAFLKQFDQSGQSSNPAYVLRRNTYLLIEPDLRRALDVVKRIRAAPDLEKRAFVTNPRTAIARELELDGGSALVTALFVETKQYSDRVIGLGLWEKPDLPWLRKIGVEWLPEKFPARVHVDGQQIEVNQPEAEDLKKAVDAAEKTGQTEVNFQKNPIRIETARDILRQIDADADPDKQPRDIPAEPPATPQQSELHGGRFVVQIKTNYEGVDYEISRKPRPSLVKHVPPPARMGQTVFKRHQDQGFQWLVDAWVGGWPGVLLADDMGLGKTFQALAFLAWIRENQKAAQARRLGTVETGPTLIVAPTALLDNWIEEAEKHMALDALGNMAKVFGATLHRFKNIGGDDEYEPLDTAKLKEYDLLLTTYETLADNHTSFAKIAYSIAVFDEMQKVKDPGTLNTLASKAMNADFVMGLTGTPVENRIEDLWSIMDRVFPGYLGDLKTFSKTHKDATEEKYRTLNDRLSKQIDGAPPVMLRRMKEDVLEGLPPKEVKQYRTSMPSPQAQIYNRIVTEALAGGVGTRGRGAMLEVIQKLRSISLYPDNPWSYDFTTKTGCQKWIERSARLGKTIEILRDIDKRGEKALVFVEHRYMQERLADAVTTLFALDSMPFVINGSMPGSRRQKRVNEFQARRNRFDVLILSPKAAGIGLTITAANHVIHLSRWWNPAVEDQCNDRVYRIGQNKPVTIHIPIAVHPVWGERTFDVTLDRLLTRKRTMSRTLLAPPVSEQDLGDVFSATFGTSAAA